MALSAAIPITAHTLHHQPASKAPTDSLYSIVDNLGAVGWQAWLTGLASDCSIFHQTPAQPPQNLNNPLFLQAFFIKQRRSGSPGTASWRAPRVAHNGWGQNCGQALHRPLCAVLGGAWAALYVFHSTPQAAGKSALGRPTSQVSPRGTGNREPLGKPTSAGDKTSAGVLPTISVEPSVDKPGMGACSTRRTRPRPGCTNFTQVSASTLVSMLSN